MTVHTHMHRDAPLPPRVKRRYAFIDLLRQQLDGLSYTKLAEEIREAALLDPSCSPPIDRRKLQALVDGEDVYLNPTQMDALDSYLSPLGFNFAEQPIFAQHPLLVTQLARAELVSFLLLRYGLDKRTYFDAFDVEGMSGIIATIARHQDMHRPVTDFSSEGVHGQDGWLIPQKLRKNRSLIALGAPRYNRATEMLLADMFGVLPFNPDIPAAVKGVRVPVCFVRPTHNEGTFTKRDGKYKGIRIVDSAGQQRTFYEPLHLKKRSSYKSYGLIAAQHRHGHMHVVVAGSSAPATLGAAKALPIVHSSIAYLQTYPDGLSNVVWAVVEVDIDVRAGSDDEDTRSPTGQRVCFGPVETPARRA